jgi:GntR family transcriptional regulator
MQRLALAKRSDPGQAKPARVAMALEREIRSGKLGFGDRLQSENDLVQRFAMSRTTIRRGLEELAGKGLITTKTGIGSFVTFDGVVIDNALGWTRALAGHAADVETKLLRIEIVTDATLAKLLKQREKVFIAIDRSRALKSSGHVISIERSRVPYLKELEDVTIAGLKGGLVSQTLREVGLVAQGGEEWAEIECLSRGDAEIMNASVGTPVLRTRRLVRDESGRVIEYVVSLLDPAHFALHLEF